LDTLDRSFYSHRVRSCSSYSISPQEEIFPKNSVASDRRENFDSKKQCSFMRVSRHFVWQKHKQPNTNALQDNNTMRECHSTHRSRAPRVLRRTRAVLFLFFLASCHDPVFIARNECPDEDQGNHEKGRSPNRRQEKNNVNNNERNRDDQSCKEYYKPEPVLFKKRHRLTQETSSI
jgi:hypothetical protein